MPRSTSNHLITTANSQSPISEEYRMLRTNIQFSSLDDQMQVIMIVSAEAGEGRTTTIGNLAVTYAQEGKRVLLIDTDLRRPSLHDLFHLRNVDGLTNVLANKQTWSEVIKDTDVEHLQLMTAGPIPPNPSDMLGSRRLRDLIAELREVYDVILVDSPPLLAATDGFILSSVCDGVVLVVNAGKAKKENVKKAKASLEKVKARILGVVLNNATRYDAYTASL
ncbi:CpsD/CapB family tyrosine-protein kinase [Paenibacillus sp. JX-17]|uniref:non-specific protein-tyrosine kinase n=1 Tax=Paenibacillus lacisoli TaxID=3064525 RepID=A0ABT9CD61_9BACL|nr:CpsD/CapB family tyrosine-protein kinase [Paenibacillus sp. JX-17]MDO7907199.1 CpsD/CapB family tyrosine-protein kinase [Paenibacillus sp. JX-17]